MNDISINVSKYQHMSVSHKKTSIDYTKQDPIEKVAENKPTTKYSTDELTLSMLKEETENTYNDLIRIVEDLLKRQGFSLNKLTDEEAKEVKVDDKAREEAAYMIGEHGPLNAENTSDRIVEFAKAISHSDPSKLETIKTAIKDGFDAAEDLLGDLPEISQKTYDLIMEKLDAWENESETQPPK